MRHDLFRSRHDRNLMANFQNDLLRSNYSVFARLDERSTILTKWQNEHGAFLGSEVITEQEIFCFMLK